MDQTGIVFLSDLRPSVRPTKKTFVLPFNNYTLSLTLEKRILTLLVYSVSNFKIEL